MTLLFWLIISADFSPDSDQTTFLGGKSGFMDYGLVFLLKTSNDGFVSYKHPNVN